MHQYLSPVPSANGDGLAAGDSAVCNANSVNIRSTANGSTTGSQLNKGDTVSILGKAYTNGYYWYRFGASQWSRGDFFAPTASGSGGGSSTYTIAVIVDTEKHGDGGSLNLRATANSGASIVTTIPDGNTIYVQSLDGTWLAAKYGSHTGFVMAEFVMGTDAYNAGGNSGGGTITSTLREGDQSAEVSTLQQLLITKLYYCGSVDGQFGRKTTLAVKYFQERNGLTIDGIVGSATATALSSTTSAKGVSSAIENWSANQRPVVYYQNYNGSFWKNYPYDATGTSTVETVGSSACGPTAMAMAVSTLLKKAVTPPILSDWALANNYRDHNGVNGTSFGFFAACASAFGLTSEILSSHSTATFSTIQNRCNAGGLAVVNVLSASPYTSAGHYIVIYKIENDWVYVNDPNYSNRNLGQYTVAQWLGGNWFGNVAIIK